MKQIVDGAFLATLETLDLNIRKLMTGQFGGNRRTKAYGSSTEFADFRDYVPGDDLRRIDWNAFGRFEKLFIKLFIDERQLHHHVYIDTSESMNYGNPSKGYTALRIAAALGFMSVQAMDKVSFFAIGNKGCEDLCHTVVGKEAFYTAANALNNVRFSGDTDMHGGIMLNENPGNGNGISFIISDFLTDNDWKGAVDWLLFHKRQVALIQVLSPDELNPYLNGKVQLLDSEADDEEDDRHFKLEITRSTLKAYKDALEYHQNEIKRFCISREISFMTVSSDENTERMFFEKGLEAEVVR